MKIVYALLFTCLTLSPFAAKSESSQNPNYTVHSAALASLISYCHAKHGVVSEMSAGGACFKRGKQSLNKIDLKAASREVAEHCKDPSELQTCITPEIGRVVMSILRIFDADQI